MEKNSNKSFNNFIIFTLIFNMIGQIGSAQDIPSARPYNATSGYGAAVLYDARGIASDFGPRILGTPTDDKWHGGIDYNRPFAVNTDLGDLIISNVDGVVVNVNRMLGLTGAKYTVIEVGNYRLANVHQFVGGSTQTQLSLNNNTAILKYMDSPNLLRWAMIFFVDGGIRTLGQTPGTVTHNGQTYSVSNVVNVGDPIGIVGTSGTNAAHLHINTMPNVNDVLNDTYNSSPLEYFTYEDTTNTLTLLRNYTIASHAETPFGFTYQTSGQSPIISKVRMNGGTNINQGYHHVMDIDKVVFGIKSKLMIEVDTIRGRIKNGYISLGGKVDENEANHTRGTLGTTTVTGVYPLIYTKSRPWDLWYFSDFYPRIHKDHVFGTALLSASCPSNARYIDGNILLKSTAVNIRNVRTDSVESFYVLDNFKPFVEGVNVDIGNTNIYNESWTCQTNNCVSFSNNNLNTSIACNELTNSMIINVRMSEQMHTLTLNIPEFNISNRPWSSTNDSINFEFIIPNNEIDFSGGTIQFVFSGSDMNNNNLIVFPNITACHQIPKRVNGNGFTDPNTPALSFGQDKIHKISLICAQRNQRLTGTLLSIDACELSLSVTYSCSTGCIDLSILGGLGGDYTVEWQKTVHGNWSTIAGWPKTSLSGNNGQEDLCSGITGGLFKVIVTDNLCGTAEQTISVDPCKCIMIDLEDRQNVSECGGTEPDGSPQPPFEVCDGALSISVSGVSNYTVNWSNGASTNSITDLCTGEYTVTVTANGCSKTQSYTICCCNDITAGFAPYILCDANNNAEEISITEADIISPSSSSSADGAIDLTVSGSPYLTYKWTGPNGFTANSQDISGLKVGTYCVTISSGCGAPLEACYTLVDCSSVVVNVSGTVVNTCTVYSVGSISVSASGGTAPYKYKWSNGKKTSSITDLAAGQYCVTVTDVNGCSKSKCFTVVSNPTTRNGCTITCNGSVVDVLDVNTVFQNDCRYVKQYCEDGYYLGQYFVGTIYDYNSFTCVLTELCYNGQIYDQFSGTSCSDCVIFFDTKTNELVSCDVRYCYFPDFNQSIVNSVNENQSVTTIVFEGGCTFEAWNDCDSPPTRLASVSAPCNKPPFRDGNCASNGILPNAIWVGAFGDCNGPFNVVSKDTTIVKISSMSSELNIKNYDVYANKNKAEQGNFGIYSENNNIKISYFSDMIDVCKINLYDENSKLILSISKDLAIGLNNIVLQNVNYNSFGNFMMIELQFKDNSISKYIDLRDKNEIGGSGSIIYPNPTNDLVYLDKIDMRSFKIEFFDILGNLIHTKYIEMEKNPNFDTSDLVNGNYLLKCTDLIDGRTLNFKLVKI